MSFNVALNGLHAAHKRLEVAGNNIANVGTAGFKSSRAEFSALYSSAMLGNNRNAVGGGVALTNVSQNFSQGEADSSSGRPLDMRIQGRGFFVVSDGGALSYTRSGAFVKDANNYIVDNQGSRLQGYGVNDKGTVINALRTDLKIDTSNMAARITTGIAQTVNLDSSQRSLAVLPAFSPDKPETYSKVLSKTIQDAGAVAVAEVKVVDAQGRESIKVAARPAIAPADHELKQYFVKTDETHWTMHTLIDGRNPTDYSSTSPLVSTLAKQSDGSLWLVSERGLITKTSDTELSLSGWKPAHQINGVWAASPALGGAAVSLPLSDGAINGVDGNDAVMSRVLPAFNPADITTFNKSFPTPIFDSLGNQHELTQYFVKDDTNAWKMHLLINGRNSSTPESDVPLSASLLFNADGTIQSISGSAGLEVANNNATIKDWLPARRVDAGKVGEKWIANGATDSAAGITIDMGKFTQYSAVTSRTSAQQDGHAAGALNAIVIGTDGIIKAGFSNGQNKNIGQLLIATFANEQGLAATNNTRWRETGTSGIANMDAPNVGTAGSIIAGSLEGSNVELTDELVALIKAQTAYQANSKVLSTESTLMQTLIQSV